MSVHKFLPDPLPLPQTLAELDAQYEVKTRPSLVDLMLIEHRRHWMTPNYQKFFKGEWNSQCEGGSIVDDDRSAVELILENAPKDSPLRNEKWATLRKVLHVIQRRYGLDRKRRRQASRTKRLAPQEAAEQIA